MDMYFVFNSILALDACYDKKRCTTFFFFLRFPSLGAFDLYPPRTDFEEKINLLYLSRMKKPMA